MIHTQNKKGPGVKSYSRDNYSDNNAKERSYSAPSVQRETVETQVKSEE